MVFSAENAEVRRRRRERHLMVALALVLIGTTALTVYLSGPTTFLSLASNILTFGLLSLNAILILLLLFLVVRNLVKLFFERKRGIFGVKLRTKFVVAFVGFSVFPAVVLFVVAVSYIGKSTDLWLNNQIEQSLRMSDETVETFRQNKADEALGFARQVAASLAKDRSSFGGKSDALQKTLEEKRRAFQLDFLVAYSKNLEPLATAFSPGVSAQTWDFEEIGDPLRTVLQGEEWSHRRKTFVGDTIEGFVPVYSSYDPKDLTGVISAGYLVPQAFGTQMKAISQTYAQYRQLRTQKGPIELNYYILLSIVLLVVIFLSSWFGLYLSKQITTPLQALAQKTQEVASGDLDSQVEETSADEIGVLVESFNQMTKELKRSQQELEASHRELQRATQESEQGRRHMEIVLENIAAGVISLDDKDRITTINRAAEKMLGISPDNVLNAPYWDAIEGDCQPLVQALGEDWERAGKEALKRELHLNLNGGSLTLEISINALRDEGGRSLGRVVVLDDLTDIQKAQRMIAWKEVARRIAHEIKNPLTPIKLSAQRLRKRYMAQITDHVQVFDECTSTIVEQVDHLQNLVNEFHSFARMPTARPIPQSLNRIVGETISLYRGSHPHVDIQFEALDDLPDVPLDSDQIHQVLINLIENAIAVLPENDGQIQIRTTFNRRLKVVRLEVADNGAGIPPEDRERLFEPYFSTKKTGTGLGLSIARSIVTDHRGYIRVLDNEPSGTRFIIELPL